MVRCSGVGDPFTAQGIIPRRMTAAEFKFVDAETKKFAAIIERAKIKLEN